MALNSFDRLTFEEAARIIYYHTQGQPSMFTRLMEDLMTSAEAPSQSIAPKWHTEYRDYLKENKSQK
jgi:hypothetical protein